MSAVNCMDQIVTAGGRNPTSREASHTVEVYHPHKDEWIKASQTGHHGPLLIAFRRV